MRFIRDLTLAALASLAVILALEAGLRLARDRYEASFYQPDRQRGYALRPNAEGWEVMENEVYIRVNSGGLRDRERPAPRPKQTLRVAALGSSEAAAFEVPLEETFEAEIERNLAPIIARRGSRVEVLNFGVPGYSLSQQYLTLKNDVWKYAPQIVVLVWNQYNLLRNTKETNPDGPQAPFYVLRDGRLEPADPAFGMQSSRPFSQRNIAIRGRLADWMNSSYLLSMLRKANVELQNQIKALGASLRRHSGPSPAASSRRPPDYLQWWPYLPELPEMQENWKIGEAFLREMKQDCDRHGAELELVIVDEDMQSHPDAAVRKAFMRLKGLASLDASDQRLERVSEANGIPVLALAPALGEYALTHGIALHGIGANNEGHWNKLGNQLAGQMIAGQLRAHSPTVQAWTTGGR